MPATNVVSVPTVFESDGPYPVRPAIEIMREWAAEVVRDVVSRAPAGSIRAAFAGGSVGRNEVWSDSHDGARAIYSDLDLYLVLAEGADPLSVRRAAAEASVRPNPMPEGVVFHRGVEIGVYTMADLLAQPARPGTVDLAAHHVWLHGDRAIVAEMRRSLERPIPPVEALYLLENRAWDALLMRDDPRAPVGVRRATAAKVVLDVAAAYLIAEGRFQPTHDARWSAMSERAPAGVSPRLLETLVIADRIRRGDVTASLEPLRVQPILCEAWLALAPTMLGARTQAPAELVAARCRRGAVVANSREFVRMRHRAGISLPLASATAWRYARFSPGAALRTHALVRALAEHEFATTPALSFHAAYVARLASRMGCVEETFDMRVRAALKAVS